MENKEGEVAKMALNKIAAKKTLFQFQNASSDKVTKKKKSEN